MSYHDAPGLRWSILSAALDSPLHLRHRLDQPRADSAAMRLGRAVHAAVLTPAVFESSAILVPDDYVTGSGALSTAAKARAWVAEQGDDPLLVTPAEWDRCRRMREAIERHADARAWLDASTLREAAVHWHEGGDECKAQLDAVAPGAGLAWDLKTKTPFGAALSVRGAVRELVARHYCGQAGWYRRGWHADSARPRIERWGWIMVTPTDPIDVLVLEADEEMLGYGDELADLALARYREGMRTGEWPGVAPRRVLVSIPPYLRDDGDVADLGLEGVR